MKTSFLLISIGCFLLNVMAANTKSSLLSQSIAVRIQIDPNKYQLMVDSMFSLIQHLELPKNFDRWNDEVAISTENEFDVNRYFKILPGISMEPGYILDYVYSKFMGNDFPILYARPVKSMRYATFYDYCRATSAELR